jgi:hypothetical protein
LSDEFKPLACRLRAAFDDARFEAIIDVVRQHLSDDTPGLPVKRSSFFYSKPRSIRFVSGTVAARELGLTLAATVRMISSGELSGKISRVGRRDVSLVAAASLKGVLRRRRRLLTATDLGMELGISVHQVVKLRRAGLIKSVPTSNGFARELMFTLDELQRLTTDVLRRADDALVLSDPVLLSEVAQLRSMNFVDLVHSILHGSVKMQVARAGEHALFRRAVVDRDDLYGWRLRKTGKTICVRSAARMLSVSVRMIPSLVRAGCLAATKNVNGLEKRSVSEASVRAFSSCYVLGSRLALRKHTSTRRLYEWLSGAGISPVIPADTRRGISSVWRLSDLANLDLAPVTGG